MQLHCCLEQRGIEFVKTTGHFDSKENRIQNHKHVWGVVMICIGYFFMLVMLWSKPILCPSLCIGSLSTSACLPMSRNLTISSTMAARQKPQTGFSTVCRMYHYYLTPKKGPGNTKYISSIWWSLWYLNCDATRPPSSTVRRFVDGQFIRPLSRISTYSILVVFSINWLCEILLSDFDSSGLQGFWRSVKSLGWLNLTENDLTSLASENRKIAAAMTSWSQGAAKALGVWHVAIASQIIHPCMIRDHWITHFFGIKQCKWIAFFEGFRHCLGW